MKFRFFFSKNKDLKQPQRPGLMGFLRRNGGFALTILLLFMFRWTLADQYRVPSGSMEPGLQIGDHIAVGKIAYDLKIPFTEISVLKTGEPQHGDVVVFIWPVDKSTIFVKRLIGLPGDKIEIKNGFVTLNGVPIKGSAEGERLMTSSEMTYLYNEHLDSHNYQVKRAPLSAVAEELSFTVPPDSYFFMGDNRDNSADSRSWGFVKREALKGKVEGILWNVTFSPPYIDLSRTGKAL